jgi:CRISPR-associated protein (TIGR02584 family)
MTTGSSATRKIDAVDSSAPQTYPRRILLAVTGLSPQVVTETLYALSIAREPAYVPTEVHVVTTAEGANRVRLALLSADPGWFARLCRDYSLPTIAFDDVHVHVLADASGGALDDIRTPADNERAADFITEVVRALTLDPQAALHASIAGGRKTMGFYLGYALSLYGRPQDRLSHVLVDEPFESSWDFFYPTPYSRVITVRGDKLADTKDARVTLAEIPFVSLRHGLPDALLEGRASFSGSVAAARDALRPPVLIVDVAGRRIGAGGRIVPLPPAELALLCVFARALLDGEGRLAAPSKGAPDPAWAARYLRELRAVAGEIADLDATERALRRGMDGDYFSVHKSKLHRVLNNALGKAAAAPYLIDDGGVRPRRYGLALPSHAVRFGSVGARVQASERRIGVFRDSKRVNRSNESHD